MPEQPPSHDPESTLAPSSELEGAAPLAPPGRGSGSAVVDPKAAAKARSPVDLAASVAALPLVALEGDAAAGEADLEVLGLLGEGAMGRVELARQRSLRREVAIKTVRAEVESPDTIEALLREGRHGGGLEHPNIVPVHALARTAEGRPVLVMKRVEGVTWHALLRDADHPFWQHASGDRLDFHLGVLQQVANAVHFAHSRGFVHRDIKPANVMIGEFGEVYLCDWGLAVRRDEHNAAPPAGLVGTPSYLAPEMVGGGAPIGAHTDVYLLGATLHEVLTGKRRHVGSDMRTILDSASASPPVVYDASVPAELGAICNRATERDPARRFPTAAALREAIVEFRQHRGSLELAAKAAADFQAAQRDAGAGGLSEDALRRRVGESRIVFHQALRIWGDNAEARAGLAALLEWMADFELGKRNHGAASDLLAELSALATPPPALVARLGELERELARAEAADARLRELEHQGDFRVSSSMRSWIVGALLVLGAVLAAAQSAFGGTLLLTPSYALLGGFNALSATAMAAVYLRWRGTVFRTRINRQFWLTLMIVPASNVVLAGLCAALGAPIHHFLIFAGLGAAGIMIAMAISLHRDIAWVAAAPVVFGGLMVVYPGRAMELQTGGFLISMGTFVWLYRRLGARTE